MSHRQSLIKTYVIHLKSPLWRSFPSSLKRVCVASMLMKTTGKENDFDKSPPRSLIWAYICCIQSFPNTFVLKYIRPLSVSRSRRWMQLMYWQTARRLALLILDFGNKETKLGKHNAFHFNINIINWLIEIDISNQRPDFPSLSHYFLMRCAISIYRPQVRWTDLALTPAAVVCGGFENRKPLSLWCKNAYLSILPLSVMLIK